MPCSRRTSAVIRSSCSLAAVLGVRDISLRNVPLHPETVPTLPTTPTRILYGTSRYDRIHGCLARMSNSRVFESFPVNVRIKVSAL